MADSNEFGKMVSLKGNHLVVVKLSELIDEVIVDADLCDIAEVF